MASTQNTLKKWMLLLYFICIYAFLPYSKTNPGVLTMSSENWIKRQKRCAAGLAKEEAGEEGAIARGEPVADFQHPDKGGKAQKAHELRRIADEL